MWHGRAKCQPCMRLCSDSSSFVFDLVGVCRTSENGDECGIKLELYSWCGCYLQVCAACPTPCLFPKGLNLLEKDGVLGRQHTLANNTHVKSKAPTLFHTHHRSLRFCRLQPTRTQSCYCLNITACMAGMINTWRDHTTSTYLAKYKQILNYNKCLTNLQFITQSGRKERIIIKKPMLINHTAIMSINYTTKPFSPASYYFLSLWPKYFPQ
jgi:hypothetical protein